MLNGFISHKYCVVIRILIINGRRERQFLRTWAARNVCQVFLQAPRPKCQVSSLSIQAKHRGRTSKSIITTQIDKLTTTHFSTILDTVKNTLVSRRMPVHQSPPPKLPLACKMPYYLTQYVSFRAKEPLYIFSFLPQLCF